MGEPEVCLESDSITIPVDLVRSSPEHNVFHVIVHIQDIITVACHQIGTVVVALHHVDPHPLFLVAMELKPTYNSARDGRGSTPDDLCVPGKGRLEHVHQESHVLGVILQPTFSVAVDIPQSLCMNTKIVSQGCWTGGGNRCELVLNRDATDCYANAGVLCKYFDSLIWYMTHYSIRPI